MSLGACSKSRMGCKESLQRLWAHKMTPSFRERVREIITDCVITGYENANKLIDKTEAEILSLVRGIVPEPNMEVDSFHDNDPNRPIIREVKNEWNACRQAILNEIGEGDA